ncbi:MAG: zf-TFIIB domain-containing protein [Bryobacteraceae bacterium]|jgi:Zn-finger nucleic acid-binding protein
MNCPSCGAPLRLEGCDLENLACEYCKNIYYPEKNDEGVRVLDEDTEEACPICAIPLMHAILAREQIRYCTRCRGMLIPMETFLVLLQELKAEAPGQRVSHAPAPRELDRHINCPRCHQRMDTHYYCGQGNVVIDDCSRCFLNWLDHGELIRIVQAPDRSSSEGFEPKPDASLRDQ